MLFKYAHSQYRGSVEASFFWCSTGLLQFVAAVSARCYGLPITISNVTAWLRAESCTALNKTHLQIMYRQNYVHVHGFVK